MLCTRPSAASQHGLHALPTVITCACMHNTSAQHVSATVHVQYVTPDHDCTLAVNVCLQDAIICLVLLSTAHLVRKQRLFPTAAKCRSNDSCTPAFCRKPPFTWIAGTLSATVPLCHCCLHKLDSNSTSVGTPVSPFAGRHYRLDMSDMERYSMSPLPHHASPISTTAL